MNVKQKDKRRFVNAYLNKLLSYKYSYESYVNLTFFLSCELCIYIRKRVQCNAMQKINLLLHISLKYKTTTADVCLCVIRIAIIIIYFFHA